ncbi:MAG: hypothetical protein ACXVNQ_12365, partial [Bacteroidia bacterium]
KGTDPASPRFLLLRFLNMRPLLLNFLFHLSASGLLSGNTLREVLKLTKLRVLDPLKLLRFPAFIKEEIKIRRIRYLSRQAPRMIKYSEF